MATKPTDLQMLGALLRLKPPLPKSRKMFQGMFDDLHNGRVIGLSKRQRAWVESSFYHHKLDRRELPPKPETAPVKHRDQGPILDFGPLPKKPPGRS